MSVAFVVVLAFTGAGFQLCWLLVVLCRSDSAFLCCSL